MTSTYAKSIVCYFSCTGNTKALAQTTAKALDADIFEIVPEVPYTSANIPVPFLQCCSAVFRPHPPPVFLKTIQADRLPDRFPVQQFFSKAPLLRQGAQRSLTAQGR